MATDRPGGDADESGHRVTLFSNGMGHFRRAFRVESGEVLRVALPFKRAHVADALASLEVFGPVRYASPPSFTHADPEPGALRVDHDDALRGLLRQLVGAEVTLEPGGPGRSGVLAGLQIAEEVDEQARRIGRDWVVVESGGTLAKFPIDEVARVDFKQADIRAEIAKALKARHESIRPGSTAIDLALAADGPSCGAIVGYTVPVAAWKIRYALHGEGGRFTLTGSAVVDNNTDEDWDDFALAVVTGDPIAFAPDLATVSVPGRRFVRLVPEQALGHVEVDRGRPAGVAFSLPAMVLGDVDEDFEAASADSSMMMRSPARGRAKSAGAEARDIGDFCVYEARERVTIGAGRSALVPLFSVDLERAGLVLLYQHRSHSKRPYRAVEFVNETGHSLGRGQVVVDRDGVFSGMAVLEPARPGESQMLPHALENGVAVVKELGPIESSLRAVQIHGYLARRFSRETAATSYVVTNANDEPFRLLLEHDRRLDAPGAEGVTTTGAEVVATTAIVGGVRFEIALPARGSVELGVVEVCKRDESIALGRGSIWAIAHVVTPGHPLADDPHVRACLTLAARVNELEVQIAEYRSRIKELDGQADRVRKNLGAVSQASEVRSRWVADLDAAELAIRAIQDGEIPKLKVEIAKLQADLAAAIEALDLSWRASPKGKAAR